MAITRREFVVYSVAALAMRPDRHDTPSCAVLDLEDQCGIRESIAGYRSALANATPRRPLLVVPAAIAIPIWSIESWLGRGATVIVESGAVFAEPESREALAHRATLRDGLRIHVDAPLALWQRAIPYVHYTWPSSAMIRDFSRVVPLRSQDGEIIASVNAVPVGVMRRVGRGTLVFLGSPLGPALWAGDVEARRWLLDVASTTMT